MPIISGGTLYKGISQKDYWTVTAAPVNDTTGIGIFQKGDLVCDVTNAKLYIVTATNGTSTITFTVVGSQT